jgi:hypothetical protein
MATAQKDKKLVRATPVGPDKRGFEWLGCGYKGYEYYADTRSVVGTHSIFDMKKLKANYETIAHSEEHSTTGDNKSKYYSKLFANLELGGTYEMFSASVTTSFDKSLLLNYESDFGSKTRVAQLYRLSVPDDAPLDETFSSDLNSMDPDKLFDKYGTHVLRSFIVGGRFQYWSYSEKSSQEQNFNFKVALDAGFDKVFKAKGGGGSELSQEEKNVISRGQYDNWGGDVVEGTYQQWFAGIKESNAAIAAFEKGSLVALYELVRDNPERRELLKAAHDSYMKRHAAPVMLKPDPDAPPGPVKLQALKYGDPFRLQTEDGTYWVSDNSEEFSNNPLGPFGKGPQEYFPKLRKADGVKLYFDAGTQGEINPENYLMIRTTEDSVSNYNFLARFTLDTRAYYYTEGWDEEKWVVTKVSNNTDKQHLFYGDVVEISMYKWPTYTLCKSGDYLSTTGITNIGCEGTRWRIVK